MKILLVHIDGPMPNLALMKISAHFKARGDEVVLARLTGSKVDLPMSADFVPFVPDWVYASCIFAENRGYAESLVDTFSGKVRGVQIGGCGLDDSMPLPHLIEHSMPDYGLYDIDYSMGFTSRGCIRNCSWCDVPKKEGRLKNHAPITEFWNPEHEKLILLDNSFLASPKWKENMNFIIKHEIKVNFSQGLDIRLLNDRNVSLLSAIDFRTRSFGSHRVHFAFDYMGIEADIRKGIKLLEKHGIKPHRLVFYVLCGYNTTHEEDKRRFTILTELGCDPFIMKYNHRLDDKWLNHFARWVNRRIYKSCSWEKYDYGKSQDIIKREKKREKVS